MGKGEGKMRKKNASLSKLLMWAFGAFAAAVLVLLVCMDWFLIKSYQLAKREQEATVLQTAVSTVRTDMDRINNTIFDFYENNSAFEALSNELTTLEEFSYSYDLNEALKARLILEDCLDGYILFYDHGRAVRYYTETDKVDADDIYELKAQVKSRINDSGTGWKWSYALVNGTKYGYLLANDGGVSLCLIYNLTSREDALMDSAPENCRLFFVDTEGVLGEEGSPERQLLEELGTASGVFSRTRGSRSVTAYRIGSTNLWLCMQITIDLFFYMSGGQMLLLLITVLAVVGIAAMQRRMGRFLILPLRRLVQTMNRIRDGQWETKVESADFEEIQKVNDALEAMVGEIKKQKILTYEHMLEKQQTQMRFLQLQLKPHFYLNGLKTLNALVMEQDWQKTQDLIINLSEHLRYLLQAERETVPLQAEVDYVRNYTELKKNMTGRPFSVTWDIQPTRRSWQVPTLCIQTFLENSFKYAKMGSAQKQLLLRISIRELETMDGPYLDICVRDNGCGYPEDVLDSINLNPDREGLGVGIKNLQRRCQLLYAGKAEYNFYNDNGAVSELSLPWKGDRSHEDPGGG